MYYRTRGLKKNLHHRWHGPARNIGRDKYGYLLIHDGCPILCASNLLTRSKCQEMENVRIALDSLEFNHSGETRGRIAGKHGFIDLRQERFIEEVDLSGDQEAGQQAEPTSASQPNEEEVVNEIPEGVSPHRSTTADGIPADQEGSPAPKKQRAGEADAERPEEPAMPEVPEFSPQEATTLDPSGFKGDTGDTGDGDKPSFDPMSSSDPVTRKAFKRRLGRFRRRLDKHIGLSWNRPVDVSGPDDVPTVENQTRLLWKRLYRQRVTSAEATPPLAFKKLKHDPSPVELEAFAAARSPARQVKAKKKGSKELNIKSRRCAGSRKIKVDPRSRMREKMFRKM